MSVHLRHAHVILREGGDVLLVLLKAVRNVFFPVALLVCYLALIEHGLGVIFFIEQAGACHQESEKAEAEDHDAGLLVLQSLKLNHLEGSQKSESNGSNRNNHSNHGKCTDSSALHQLLVAIRHNLFLKHLLQAAARNRCNRNRQLRLAGRNLLRCGTNPRCGIALTVLLCKLGLRFRLLYGLNLLLATEDILRSGNSILRCLRSKGLRRSGSVRCNLRNCFSEVRCLFGEVSLEAADGFHRVLCDIRSLRFRRRKRLAGKCRRFLCGLAAERRRLSNRLNRVGHHFCGFLRFFRRLVRTVGRRNRCRVVRLRRIVERLVEELALATRKASLR